ncbi:MAG TPA: penicillin-binding protein 2 [Candidatus Andersenbacteria bacterium]|nr:penicillin-binding protein 2 [Candidatus Andersenbacteria bacterium]
MNLKSADIIEHIHSSQRPSQKRFGILNIFLILIVLGIGARGAYLQVVKGSSFRAKAEHNRVDSVILPAPRGIIYDRNHTQLVENISSTDLVFKPNQLPTVSNESDLIDSLTSLLPTISPDQIRSALDRARKTGQETLIAKALDHETVLTLEQHAQSLLGTSLESSLVRKYLYSQALAHVLGYTNPVTAEQLNDNPNLVATDTTGKQGIEQQYDAALRGEHGMTYTEINAAGKEQTDLGEKQPIPGQDLSLTIDAELQKFIYGLFSDFDSKTQQAHGEPVRGAAIVMDVTNGELYSLVSYPSYDPNTFSQPFLRNSTTPYFTDKTMPLFNRATNGMYPPGSTIKPFLAAAALQEGVITPTTTVDSVGGITVGSYHFLDWKAGGHGITDVKKALANSVNTFFYMVAGGLGQQQGLGVDRATKYLQYFGFNQKSGIDLPSEASGFLPSPQWKLETTGQPWYIGDTYHMGIGQGGVLVTPLQIAAGTAAVANGSTWYEPHLVQANPKKHAIPISRQDMQVVQDGMRQTITDGSGRSLNALPIPIAGKTGTAQIDGSDKTHAWFTSFGPYGNPKFAVTVLLEQGGGGDVVAVPIAHEIWQWLYEHELSK